MKKFLKIILINIILCIIFLGILEVCCIYKEYIRLGATEYKFTSHLKNIFNGYTSFNYVNENEIRPVSYPKHLSNKAPLITMGCSFAYGLWLDDNETLASQLANKTHRVVYNLGITGASPREMLYILRNNELRCKLLENKNDFEYIIYPYISDHLFRLYNQLRLFSPSPSFKQKGDSLEFYQPKTYLIRSELYQEIIKTKYRKIKGKKSFDLLCLYLREINREIKKHFPKAQFVVFVYEDPRNEDWSVLEKEGITVINYTQLTGNYLSTQEFVHENDGKHPNAKAWEEIAPILIEKLNL